MAIRIKNHFFFFSLICMICMLSVVFDDYAYALKETNLYVAPNGNDQWSGTLSSPNQTMTDGPFATLERARNAIKTLKILGHSHDKFNVRIRGGLYSLNSTFSLGAEDSGTVSAPITYKAFKNEKPVLSGAFPVSNFVSHNGLIYKADLRGTYIALNGMRQLFAGTKRQTLARFPNIDPNDPFGKGFLYVESSVEEGSKTKFKYGKGQVNTWDKPDYAEIVIFPGPNYWNNTIAIHAIDRMQRTVTLAGSASYGIVPGNRYYFQNIQEELDSPGEWYFDHPTKTLFFWPTYPEMLKFVSVPHLKRVLQINGGTSNVKFEGLSITGCNETGVFINGASSIMIAKCNISNTGGNGIEGYNVTDVSIIGNDIKDTGGAGIMISGGVRKTLSAGKNCIKNNYIRNIGVYTKYSAGIRCDGVGNVVAHNLVHDTPRIGIQFDGNDHVIEFNHVHHVNQETQDSGVIYSCARDWTKRGNIIRYNYVHDSGGYGRNNTTELWRTPFNTFGIYLDDFSSGTEVYGNIVVDTCRGGIFVHGGRDNIIKNNLLIGSNAQLVLSSIADTYPELPLMFHKIKEMGFSKYSALSTIKDPKQGSLMYGNQFVNNIVYRTKASSALYNIYGYLDLNTHVSDNNIICPTESPLQIPYMKVASDLQWSKWKESGMDQNSLIADPMFVDKKFNNFQLNSKSPALKKGFQQIPFDMIGPYADSMRASWPIPTLKPIKGLILKRSK